MDADAWLARQFRGPHPDYRRIVARVQREPARIVALMGGLGARGPAVRFGCAKALHLVAEADPHLLYPHFGFFVGQLDSGNNILRWNALLILACLAPADSENKLEAVLDKYLSPIDGPQMIAAATAIQGAAIIACAQPRLAGRIARAILRVSGANYQTPECRNVAIGHAIQSLRRFFGLVGNTRAIVAFVRAQLNNPRTATGKKAAAFLRGLGGAGRNAPQQAAEGRVKRGRKAAAVG